MVTPWTKGWALPWVTKSVAPLVWLSLVLLTQKPWTTTTTAARGFQIPFPRTPRKILTVPRMAVKEQSKESIATDQHSMEIPSYERKIVKFLESKRSNLLNNFHIQGWRWHTKSLARDAGRLQKLAATSDLKDVEALQRASDFVIGFNMVGLHKIEASLFFPWMREQLTSRHPQLKESFSEAMDVLETDRCTVASLGEQICISVRTACNTNLPDSLRSSAIAEIADRSGELQILTRKMIALEDRLLVPAIGATVSVKEQKSFNNRVLLKLGILDSRLHLVGMYEAVWEEGDWNEKKLFEEAIPSLSRKMIPRWKRKLYQPKTEMLE